MKVSFMAFNETLASTRYRALIPARELQAMGVQAGRDVLIAGKHGWDWDKTTRGFRRVVYDCCTNHFVTKHREFYLNACARADAVVAASAEMARIVKRETGRDAWVIEDPYEESEWAPRVGPHLLWHGHARNVREIEHWRRRLEGYRLTMVTGGGQAIPPGYVQWSPDAMEAAYREAGMVVLPYIGNPESTANRAVNAIRRGLWPVCGPMPALAPLGVWQGDVEEGVAWALDNQQEVLDRISALQDVVERHYSPRVIAEKWRRMLETVA